MYKSEHICKRIIWMHLCGSNLIDHYDHLTKPSEWNKENCSEKNSLNYFGKYACSKIEDINT